MDGPIARLEETRGELAKAWLMRALGRASLDEIERLPTARIARELPELIAEIARAARPEAEQDAARYVEWAKRLADLTGHEGARRNRKSQRRAHPGVQLRARARRLLAQHAADGNVGHRR